MKASKKTSRSFLSRLRKGFSLTESLVAVSIAGAVSVVGMQAYNGVIANSDSSAVETSASTLNNALQSFIASGGIVAPGDSVETLIAKMRQGVSASDALQRGAIGNVLGDLGYAVVTDANEGEFSSDARLALVKTNPNDPSTWYFGVTDTGEGFRIGSDVTDELSQEEYLNADAGRNQEGQQFAGEEGDWVWESEDSGAPDAADAGDQVIYPPSFRYNGAIEFSYLNPQLDEWLQGDSRNPAGTIYKFSIGGQGVQNYTWRPSGADSPSLPASAFTPSADITAWAEYDGQRSTLASTSLAYTPIAMTVDAARASGGNDLTFTQRDLANGDDVLLTAVPTNQPIPDGSDENLTVSFGIAGSGDTSTTDAGDVADVNAGVTGSGTIRATVNPNGDDRFEDGTPVDIPVDVVEAEVPSIGIGRESTGPGEPGAGLGNGDFTLPQWESDTSPPRDLVQLALEADQGFTDDLTVDYWYSNDPTVRTTEPGDLNPILEERPAADTWPVPDGDGDQLPGNGNSDIKLYVQVKSNGTPEYDDGEVQEFILTAIGTDLSPPEIKLPDGTMVSSVVSAATGVPNGGDVVVHRAPENMDDPNVCVDGAQDAAPDGVDGALEQTLQVAF